MTANEKVEFIKQLVAQLKRDPQSLQGRTLVVSNEQAKRKAAA